MRPWDTVFDTPMMIGREDMEEHSMAWTDSAINDCLGGARYGFIISA